MSAPQQARKRWTVKQIVSGDTIQVHDKPMGGLPNTKLLYLSNITVPKLAKPKPPAREPDTKDEAFAWEAREFLRKKLIGKEVLVVEEINANGRATVYLGEDEVSGENIAESLVAEGLADVRSEKQESLQKAKLAAEAGKKGKHGVPSEKLQDYVRDVKWTVSDPRSLLDQYGKKPVRAIIEAVLDSTRLKLLLLPDNILVQMKITGIRGPADAALSEEAKFFVEKRLLQRDVEVILESESNFCLIGTVVHPKGNIAEVLLRDGYAECDWSINCLSDADRDKYRAAEKEAIDKKLRRWKNGQPKAPQLTGKEKEFTGTVVEVVGGDALMVKVGNDPPRKIFLSSITPPRLDKPQEGEPERKLARPLYEIPCMFEAREFLRKKLIGKKVNVIVDYKRAAVEKFPEKTCCTVTIGGVNHNQLRQKYENIKKIIRRKSARMRCQSSLTGGDSSDAEPLTLFEEKIKSMLLSFEPSLCSDIKPLQLEPPESNYQEELWSSLYPEVQRSPVSGALQLTPVSELTQTQNEDTQIYLEITEDAADTEGNETGEMSNVTWTDVPKLLKGGRAKKKRDAKTNKFDDLSTKQMELMDIQLACWKNLEIHQAKLWSEEMKQKKELHELKVQFLKEEHAAKMAHLKNNNNVGEALVGKGLGRVIRHSKDDDQRSSRYEQLLAEEKKAEKSLKGIHAPKDNKGSGHRVSDISNDPTRARQVFSSLQRLGQVEALVEYVTSGSRLRLYIPRETCLVTFLLAGISCPRGSRPGTGGSAPVPGDPYGEEALQFTKERCMQREVFVRVESMDKARPGNLIGWLFVDDVNLSVRLVEEGLATVHFSAEKSQYYQALKAAQDHAKGRRLNIWKDHVEEEVKEEKAEEEERKVDQQKVLVVEATRELKFFAQNVDQGPKLEALMNQIHQEFQSSPPTAGAFTPRRGDLCASKFSVDDQWYRARVEKVAGKDVHVLYIDYGNKEVTTAVRCASLPAAFTADRPYANEFTLAFAKLPKDDADYQEDAIAAFKEDVLGKEFLLNIEYRIEKAPFATLTTVSENKDIGKELVRDGFLLVDVRKEKRLQKLVSEYKTAQEEAQKGHKVIWRYGDITEDDAKEFGR